MRVVCTADFHGYLPSEEELPDGDLLIVAGDITPVWNHRLDGQRTWIQETFAEWLEGPAAKYGEVVVIGGNHDFILEQDPTVMHDLACVYLDGEATTSRGLTVFGSPMVGSFGPWAFMRDEHDLFVEWQSIPEGVDIVVVHGPAYGVLDLAQRMVNCGSPSLRERIIQVKPKLLVTGHIHEAYGQDLLGETKCVNGAFVSGAYEPGQLPIVVEL